MFSTGRYPYDMLISQHNEVIRHTCAIQIRLLLLADDVIFEALLHVNKVAVYKTFLFLDFQ